MARNIDIVVSESPAIVVADRLAAAVRNGGNIVLTGGSSVAHAYEVAAPLEPDWSNVDVWFTDERCVPPDDENSNFRLVEQSLLANANVPRVHRMHGELGCDEGAERYEAELAAIDHFDFVLLGLGPDGHVASLFPLQPTLDETERKAIGAEAKLEPYIDRITLTLPMLRGAREVVFTASGEKKADACVAAFEGDPTRETPGSLVRSIRGVTTAVLDAAAASKV